MGINNILSIPLILDFRTTSKENTRQKVVSLLIWPKSLRRGFVLVCGDIIEIITNPCLNITVGVPFQWIICILYRMNINTITSTNQPCRSKSTFRSRVSLFLLWRKMVLENIQLGSKTLMHNKWCALKKNLNKMCFQNEVYFFNCKSEVCI